MSASQRNDARTIAVDPSLAEILRLQTLLVLAANHEPFEDVRYLAAPELVTLAAIWRDAIGVLDAIGWLPVPRTGIIDVAVTAGHTGQLRRLRVDEAMAILDCLEARDELVTDGDLAEIDAEIRRRRLSVQGLGELVRRYHQAGA